MCHYTIDSFCPSPGTQTQSEGSKSSKISRLLAKCNFKTVHPPPDLEEHQCTEIGNR